MRLFRTLVLAAIGYAVYEMLRGSSRSESRGWSFDALEGASGGRQANLTGGGRGSSEWVEDSDGAQMRTIVGRGVLRP